jgi:DNA-binding NtrC family response regulator
MYKLLIMDDEEKLRNLMARILSLEGYEVKEARDVQSVWKMLDKESFEDFTGFFSTKFGKS